MSISIAAYLYTWLHCEIRRVVSLQWIFTELVLHSICFILCIFFRLMNVKSMKINSPSETYSYLSQTLLVTFDCWRPTSKMMTSTTLPPSTPSIDWSSPIMRKVYTSKHFYMSVDGSNQTSLTSMESRGQDHRRRREIWIMKIFKFSRIGPIEGSMRSRTWFLVYLGQNVSKIRKKFEIK